MKNVPLFILAMIFVSLASEVATAKEKYEPNPAGEYLVEIGERYYKQGDIETGLHEFSKALLVDPENKKAKEYLAKHGFPQGMYRRSVTAQSQLIDMTEEIGNYQEQLALLHEQKRDIEASLIFTAQNSEEMKKSKIAKELELELVQNKLSAIEKALKDKDGDFKSLMNEMDGIQQEYEQKLNNLQDQLAEANAMPVAATENVALAQKEERIEELKNALQTDYHANMDYERKIKELLAKNEDLKTYGQDVYNWHQKIIKVLEEYLRLRDEAINDYQDEVVYKHADLTSTQSDFFNSLDELVKMHTTLENYLTRLSEREKEVAKKQDDMDTLRMKLAEAQKRIAELTGEE